MRGKKPLISSLKASLGIRIILWVVLCFFVYLMIPDSPLIVPQQQITIDVTSVYIEKPEQLIDLHNFEYIIKQPLCDSHTKTLIMVHSAPANTEKRSIIRQTWGNPSIITTNSTLRLFFLFGTAENAEQQSSLLKEHTQYGDLLQGNFQDAYVNLTYKHVMALKWFHTHCEQAQMLVKVDDDIYLHTPYLLPLATAPKNALSLLLQQREHLLLCRRNDKDRVIRSYFSKWRVSHREFGDRYWPPFCPGFAVLYSADVVKRLYGAAQRSNYFRLDDVLITGLLSRRNNIAITDLKPYVIFPKDLKLLLSGRKESQELEYLVSWHEMTSQQITGLWQLYGMATTTEHLN